jgi:hypothetical protein
MKRHWKLWIPLTLIAYLAASWLAFLLPPRIKPLPNVPRDAANAVSAFCSGSDYLHRYPWGIPAAVFWQEPFTHRELRLGQVVIELESDTRVRAFCRTTGVSAWFNSENGGWQLDHSTLLAF